MAKKRMSFEESLSRLEEIQQSINDEKNTLEISMKLFEEGIALTKKLEKELNSIETKIEILTNEPEEDEEPEFEDYDE